MSSGDTRIIQGHFDDKFAQFLGNIDVIIGSKLQPTEEDVTELKTDAKNIRVTVKKTNNDALYLQQHVTKLERLKIS